MKEPLREGIEDNRVVRRWDRPPARRLASPYDGLFLLFLGMGLLLAALDPMPGVAALFVLLVAKMLVETFREPTGDTVVAGRTLCEWADLAEAGVAPREAALGLWGLRARRMRLAPPTARAVLWGAFGLLFMLVKADHRRGEPLGGTSPGELLLRGLDALDPWIAILAAIAAYFGARAWRNPWIALSRARAAFRRITPAFSDEEAKRYTILLRESFFPNPRKRTTGTALEEFVTVGCVVPIVAGFVGGVLLELLAFGTPELRSRILHGLVCACMGGLMGRFDARSDRLAAELWLLLLATEVRGTMRLACRVVRGSEGAVPGAPFDEAMDRARRLLDAEARAAAEPATIPPARAAAEPATIPPAHASS